MRDYYHRTADKWKARVQRWRSANLTKVEQYRQTWLRNNPEKRRRVSRESYSRRMYGVVLSTPEMYKNRYRHAHEQGFRSGLEIAVAADLAQKNVSFGYETLKIEYHVDEVKRYVPDFILPNGIIIEAKGRMATSDRKKMKLVKAQHPHLDIRFVFSNSRQRISKQSKTTYADWCRQHGFQFADKSIPLAWIKEEKK